MQVEPSPTHSAAIIVTTSTRRPEALYRESRRGMTVSRLEFPGDADVLSNQIAAPRERLGLRSPRQTEWLLQSWNIQFQQATALDQSPVSDHFDFRCGETRVFNGFGNQSWVEGFPALGEHFSLSLHQIHIRMINAIQALQSQLGSVRSKPSYHSVDLDGGSLDLCGSGRRQ